MLIVRLNPVELHVFTYVCTYTLKCLSLITVFSLTSLQTKEKLSQIDCEPTTETVDCRRKPPGHPDSGIAEVHRHKKMSGSSMKAQERKSTLSKPISKSAPERKPTVEGVEKSAFLETGHNGQNATMTVKLSWQNKHSNEDALKDQSKHDPCLQKAPKSKLPKRLTSGDDVAVTARETFLTDERVACKAQAQQPSTKESSKSETKGRQPLSKGRAPIKIPDKVDKKYIKEKKDDLISNISSAGKQRETNVKTAQPVDKHPKNKDIKVSDHEESKGSLASKCPNTQCRTEKTSEITTINETDGPKITQSQDSEQQRSPKIETSLQVPKSPKTGKLMFVLKWPLWLKIIEMFFLFFFV